MNAAAPVQSPAPSASASGRRRILWIPLLSVLGFWAYFIFAQQREMAMFTRFGSSMIALALMLLVFMTAWFWDWRFGWRERLFACAALPAVWGIAGALTHPSFNHFTLLISGLPLAFTGWVIWYLVAGKLPMRTRVAGLLFVFVVAFGSFTLLRSNGLTGKQLAQLDWRWNPSPEERFLSHPVETAKLEMDSEWQPLPGDWTDFRGERRAGIAPPGALPQVDGLTPTVVWKHAVGPAWSGMLVINGKLVTQEQRGEEEAVVCYSAEDGKELWSCKYPDRFEEVLSGAGPRATPVYAAGAIYSLGARGKLIRVNPHNGERVWMVDVVADMEAPLPQWGLSVTPLVVDDLVIVYSGAKKEGNALAAYRVADGSRAWSARAGDASYSSPQWMEIQGVPQVLMHHNLGLTAFEPKSGRQLWNRPSSDSHSQPMLQPQLVGDGELLIAEGSGLTMLAIKRDGEMWELGTKWESQQINPTFNDVVVHQGHIYGLDDGILCCVDLEAGERKWKGGRYGSGQVVLLAEQGLLFVAGEQGDGVFVRATPEGLREVVKFKTISGKTWNHPSLAHGRLYVRNAEEMACFRLLPEQTAHFPSAAGDEQLVVRAPSQN